MIHKKAKTLSEQVPSSSSVVEEDDIKTEKPRKTRFDANALVIATTSPYYRFCKLDSKKRYELLRTLIGPKCSGMETIPVKDEVMEADLTLFADDNGMMTGLPMNVNMNPFMDDCNIIYHAIRGGPYGNLVLVPEKGNLSWNFLEKLFKAQDKKDDDEGEDSEWFALLEEAKKTYEAQK